MKLKRTGLFMGRWCVHALGSFILWSVWLTLAAILVLQSIIAFSHELHVPNRIVRSFENGMAHAGLRVRFDTASFDSSGHVLIENLSLFSESFDEPLVTAKSIYLQVDPWALLSGSFEAKWISGRGVTLYVPAMVSPSGRSDPVLQDLTLLVERDDADVQIRQLTGHAGPLAVNIRGALRLPRGESGAKRTQREIVATGLAEYLRVSKELLLAQARLSGFENPSLQIALKPDEKRVARVDAKFSARSANLSKETLALPRFEQNLRVDGLVFETTFPLIPPPTMAFQVRGRADAVHTADGASIDRLRTVLNGRFQTSPAAFVPREVLAAAASVSARGYELEAVSLSLRPQPLPKVAADASFSFLGEPWSVQADVDVQQHAGLAAVEGTVSPRIIAEVGKKLGRDLTALLAPEKPIRLSARTRLDPGWKPSDIRGRVEVGKVVAHAVSLNQASANLHFAGTDLDVTDIVLEQGQNLALGNYRMDTKTLDYRFLLTGRLRPVGIAGWFHDWWTRFWGNFDFSAAAPIADVDVQGRWGEPHLSTVFVHVDCDAPVIRSVPLDQVRITLFIRPDFYDALDLHATRGNGSARGSFTRSVDLNQKGFRWMEFQVASTLDLQESARLFGKEGTDLVEPFRFEKPPQLKLSGRLEGEASGRGTHEDVLIEAVSSGGFWFFDFPLSNLACRAEVHDDEIRVPDVKVNFATGSATGHALVNGRGNDRKLAFDASITDAGLGESIRILEDFSARRRGEKPPPVSRFQQRVASGKLSLKASATGLYHESRSYVGQGSAELKGAELAQINMLGALSAALRGNSLLGFTSWRLDTAQARFSIERDRLVFPELTITGPTAKLDAKGAYGLESKKMDFNAKFYPFEKGKTLLANAVDLVLTPVSAVLELKLTGSLDNPRWFFTYGPTSLLRKLAGADSGPKGIAEEPVPAPSPLLRP